MDLIPEDRFVRVSNALLDAFLQLKLTGVQWRILLWTLRNANGWNRPTTPFSWYRIAKELALDRAGVNRAGKRLIGVSVLVIKEGRLGIREGLAHREAREIAETGDACLPMTPDIADGRHPNRGQRSSLFRRAKDRCKD